MKIKQKAEQLYGDKYYKHCPSRMFGFRCRAYDKETPKCFSKNCWSFHGLDHIECSDDCNIIDIDITILLNS